MLPCSSRRGRNPKQVQAWLGHHDPGFTLATYVHLMDEGVGDAAFFDAAVTREGGDGQPATIPEALEVEVV